MKMLLLPSLLIALPALAPLIVSAQEGAVEPPPGVRKQGIKLPQAVTEAAVRREKVVPGTAGGGSLTIQVIDAPVLPPPAPPPAAAGPRLTPEQRAALRAAAPEVTRLFSPYITPYPNGVTHISWTAAELGAGAGAYEAWLNMDLSAFEFMQDVTVGKTRFVVMPLMMDCRWRSVPKRIPPDPGSFKGPSELIMEKGDAQNQAALAPLNAMLALYAEKGPELLASAQARKAEWAAAAEWEKSHPSPKPSVTVKLCPLDVLPPSASTPAAPAK